ncbi:MAG: MucR family transcriptional regulator [Rhodospirillaceae bacterium]
MDNSDPLALTARIVAAYVANNQLRTDDLSGLITSVHQSLTDLGKPAASEAEAKTDLKPAVPIKKSINPDHIVCLEDGKKLKMLKRHLMSTYGMTPDQYRAKWGLPSDYPMVAPNYAKARSELALKLGLGRNTKSAA